MIAYILAGLLLIGGVTNALAQATATIVKYRATINDVKYVYAAAPPVAQLKSGDILETNTVDAFGNVIQKPGDPLSLVKGDNPFTGPFYIEGAEPGDTLAVKILDLEVDSNQGVGVLGPGFGALNETSYTPMLHAPLPEKIWFYPIDHASERCDLSRAGFGFFGEDPPPSIFRLHRSGASRRRGAQFDSPGGLWWQHGFAGGERGEHRIPSRECVRSIAVHGRWPRGYGRRRNCRIGD